MINFFLRSDHLQIVHKICTQHQAQCFNESKSVVKIAMDADELKTPMSLLLNPPKPVEEDFTLSKVPRRRTVEVCFGLHLKFVEIKDLILLGDCPSDP